MKAHKYYDCVPLTHQGSPDKAGKKEYCQHKGKLAELGKEVAFPSSEWIFR